MIRIEYQPIDTLKPAKRNPRTHQEDGISASIGRFGMGAAAAVVDERTGRMVAGHGRRKVLMAMQAAGQAPPEGVRLADDGATWLVPVLRGWASKSDKEAEAFLIADNRHTELATWDPAGLLDMLQGVGDLTGVGFTDEDMAGLMADLTPDVEEPKGDHDVCPTCGR